MVWVMREPGGAVCGVSRRPGTDGHTERLPDDDPDVVAFMNRDIRKPWPEQLTMTAGERQKIEDFLKLNGAEVTRDLVVLFVELAEKLLAAGVIAPTDFTPAMRARYVEIRTLAERWRDN